MPREELNLDTSNPAHATIKKLLSPPVDVLLRPPGGWKRPDDLLGALAKEAADARKTADLKVEAKVLEVELS